MNMGGNVGGWQPSHLPHRLATVAAVGGEYGGNQFPPLAGRQT